MGTEERLKREGCWSSCLPTDGICSWRSPRRRTKGGEGGRGKTGRKAESRILFKKVHVRTDFLLQLVLELVRLVKLRAVARGHDQLGRVVAGGSRIGAHDRGDSGQAEED